MLKHIVDLVEFLNGIVVMADRGAERVPDLMRNLFPRFKVDYPLGNIRL